MVILGGGVSGLTVARNLKDGLKVVVLEEAVLPGGLAFQLGCKATSECLYCGVCRALDVKRTMLGFPLLSGRRIVEVTKQNGVFVVETDQELLTGKILVVATGALPFDARKMPNFGWKRLPNVYTGFELETALNQGALQHFKHFQRVAFIQCVGSRNAKEQRSYCSQVCCRYALRLATDLLFLYPHLGIDFYYMDLQVLGKKADTLWEVAQKIRLVRQMPFEAREMDGQIALLFEGARGVESQPYDAVILSVGMVPSPGTRRMAEMLQLNVTTGGFIKDFGDGRTSREGVFVCGTACGPKDIETSLEEARRVSQRIQKETGGRNLEEGALALQR